MLRRPQEHTHTRPSANHFCATVDRPIGTVSDSGMKDHSNCPDSPRLVHQQARHPHPRLHRLVDARHHQETPDTHSLWVQFVIVFVMEAPNADRTVAWSSSYDSTQTEATNNQAALGIESSLCHNR